MATTAKEGKLRVPEIAAEEGAQVCRLLVDWIREGGMSIREVERELGWGQGTLRQVLAGEQPIRFSHAASVAGVVGFRLSEFYGEMARIAADREEGGGKTPPPPPSPDRAEEMTLEEIEGLLRKARAVLRERQKRRDEKRNAH